MLVVIVVFLLAWLLGTLLIWALLYGFGENEYRDQVT